MDEQMMDDVERWASWDDLRKCVLADGCISLAVVIPEVARRVVNVRGLPGCRDHAVAALGAGTGAMLRPGPGGKADFAVVLRLAGRPPAHHGVPEVPADKNWFREFDKAAPDAQRAMLAALKAEESSRLLGEPEVADSAKAEETSPDIRDWLHRVQGEQPKDLDRL